MSEIKNKKLLVLGAGGHGKVCVDCAAATGDYSHIAFLDDIHKGKKVLGYDVLGGFKELGNYSESFDEYFVAIGNNNTRVRWFGKLVELGLKSAILIHPDSTVSSFADIGLGSVIMAGAVVNANATLRECVIVNSRAVVEHDCLIGKGTHISPGAIIAGNSQVGNSSWICMGAKISNNVKIGNNTTIAANSTVLDDIEDNVMAAGTPAIVKKRK